MLVHTELIQLKNNPHKCSQNVSVNQDIDNEVIIKLLFNQFYKCRSAPPTQWAQIHSAFPRITTRYEFNLYVISYMLYVRPVTCCDNEIMN